MWPLNGCPSDDNRSSKDSGFLRAFAKFLKIPFNSADKGRRLQFGSSNVDVIKSWYADPLKVGLSLVCLVQILLHTRSSTQKSSSPSFFAYTSSSQTKGKLTADRASKQPARFLQYPHQHHCVRLSSHSCKDCLTSWKYLVTFSIRPPVPEKLIVATCALTGLRDCSSSLCGRECRSKERACTNSAWNLSSSSIIPSPKELWPVESRQSISIPGPHCQFLPRMVTSTMTPLLTQLLTSTKLFRYLCSNYLPE